MDSKSNMPDPMNSNPYEPPSSGASHAPKGSSLRRAALNVLKYLLAYASGIVACVLLTHVDGELAGKTLWPFYFGGSPIGYVFFYFIFSPAEVWGPSAAYWLLYAFGLLPFLIPASALIGRLAGTTTSARLRSWRPFWIAFPVGFVGTVGIFTALCQSI